MPDPTANSAGKASTARNTPRRRSPYTSRACDQCRRRKVKCSGKSPCWRCLAQNEHCYYAPSANFEWQPVTSSAKENAREHQRRRQQPQQQQQQTRSETDVAMLSRLQILEEECLQLQNSTSSDDSMVAGSLAPSKDKNTNTNIPNPQASPVRPQSQGEGQGQGYLQGSIDHQVVDMPGSIYPYKSPDTEALQNPQWDQPNADATDPFTFKGNEVDATDTFTFKSNGLKDMTMPSKLTALHEDLALQSVVSTSPTIDSGIEDPSKMIGYGGFCGNDSTIELQLPRPQELNSLLQIYFIEHNLFFPCVDRRSFEAKLLKMLIDKGYGRGNQTVRLSVTERSFGALLCVMLALAVFINPQEPLYKNEMPLSAHTACHSWHRMGLVLSEPSQLAKIQGIDIVRYHLLEAMYLINIERLAEASRAVVIAIDMAIRMGLNRQKTWEASHADQTLERRMLWWTLYYMDRKLAEKCSRPCFIRDTEVDVDDFAAALATGGAKQREMLQSATGRTWDVAYLQTLVDWARLWGKIWDTFFAARAQGLGNSDEVEAMDARIEGVRRRLPAEVRWDTSLFQLLDHSAENELQIRAQLLVLVRFNLLRLNLRHNPLTKPWHDQFAISFCGSLALETVNTLVTYLDRFPNIGQLGFFVTVALVECVCQLIPSIVMGVSQPDREAAIRAVNDSQHIIHLVSLRHAAATRAETALSQVFSIINAWSKNDEQLHGQDLQFEPGSGTISPTLFEFLCDGDIWNFDPGFVSGFEVDGLTGDFSSTLKTFLQDSGSSGDQPKTIGD